MYMPAEMHSMNESQKHAAALANRVETVLDELRGMVDDLGGLGEGAFDVRDLLLSDAYRSGADSEWDRLQELADRHGGMDELLAIVEQARNKELEVV